MIEVEVTVAILSVREFTPDQLRGALVTTGRLSSLERAAARQFRGPSRAVAMLDCRLSPTQHSWTAAARDRIQEQPRADPSHDDSTGKAGHTPRPPASPFLDARLSTVFARRLDSETVPPEDQSGIAGYGS
jgi:hypothetical protein